MSENQNNSFRPQTIPKQSAQKFQITTRTPSKCSPKQDRNFPGDREQMTEETNQIKWKSASRKTVFYARSKPPTTNYQCDSFSIQRKLLYSFRKRKNNEVDPERNKNLQNEHSQITEKQTKPSHIAH